MKSLISILLLLLLPVFSIAQQFPYWETWSLKQIDSLKLIWEETTNDTIRMGTARSLGFCYQEIDQDTALYFHQKQVELARKLKLKLWEADALENIGYVLSMQKSYPQSLKAFLATIEIAEDKEAEKNIWQVSRFSKVGDPALARLVVLAFCRQDLGRLYGFTGNVKEELSNAFEALSIAEHVADPAHLANINMNTGRILIKLNQLDSALLFEKRALAYTESSGFYKYNGTLFSNLGTIYLKKGNYALAKQYFAKAIHESTQQYNLYALADASINFGNVLNLMGDRDSSLWYVKRALGTSKAKDLSARAYSLLASIYKQQNNMDSAFFYQSLAMAEKDSINNIEKIKQFENIGFDEQLRVRQLEKEKAEYQNRIRTYSMLAGLGVFFIIAFIFYRNNRQKQKANQVLVKTLSNLKSTQSQLIQSEKMASLGELTAGIAHEIQNPLNFVNNFSEVSNELIKEIQDIRRKTPDQNTKSEEDEILNDIAQNLEKINHHGKRADAIVKGMLQHSRSSSGQKELTDINALCDEYLRLSYHGLRAKDKSFNAKFETDFDSSLTKVNVVPQDIGRVVLNLINNAFYAVNERLRQTQPDSGYEPTVTVSTKRSGEKIEILVKDNGNGIPDSIKEKIFQPFFTTKPTGQGTGLGLSLSYDIVKAHGGELKVETKHVEGLPADLSIRNVAKVEASAQAGSEFIIQLTIV